MTTLAVARVGVRPRSGFPFAGCSWRLTTDSPFLTASFGSAFPDNGSEAAAAFHLDLQSSAAEESLWATPYFRGRDHLVFAAFSNRDVMIFDLLGRRGVGTISRTLAEDYNYWRRVIVPAVIGLASPSVGIAPLHCATLVRDGMGLHIAGLSGAGKSTLAYALAQRGFRLLSDDWTYFTRSRHGLQCAGLPVPIKLLPDTQRFFPELKRHTITKALNGEFAYEIDVENSLSPSRAYSCIPSRLVFFRRERSVGGPRLTRLTSMQVEAQFRPSLERIPDCLAQARETQHAVIAELAKVPAYSLVCDGSPDQIATWIDDFAHRDAGAIAAEDFLLPPHCEIPDLMLRFAPAPLIGLRSDFGIRIETDVPAIHQHSPELARSLRDGHGSNLSCTFLEDRADWASAAASFGRFAYRCVPKVGCMFLDRQSGRMVSFVAPSAVAELAPLERLIAPVVSS